jgi:hypothetical protein
VSSKYESIVEVSPALVGEKVVSAVSDESEPPEGTVISVNGTYLWVNWAPNRPPERLGRHALLLVSKTANFTKSLKWHGQELGELRRFIEQAYREGATDKTKLSEPGDRHVHVELKLPLAPIPEPGDKQPDPELPSF